MPPPPRCGASAPLLAFALLCRLAAPLGAQPAPDPVPDGRPHQLELRDERFLLDGQPLQLIAGEMHFGRTLPEDWELRLAQAKAMGLNTVSFYLFWNLCEPREGEFTFTGLTDVRRMLQLCQAQGLWAVLRPGPYCCAEVEYGGIPWWTAKHPEVKIRSNDPVWLAWTRRYIEEVYRQVGDLEVTRGGPLLMVQLENEIGITRPANNDYMASLQRIFQEAGFTVPLFTCDPAGTPEWRDPAFRLPGVLHAPNGLRNERTAAVVRAAIGDHPIFIPELYTAWFTGWGQPIATRNAGVEQTVAWTTFALDHQYSFCYYMFFGGTTFGFWNGCNEHLPVHTSYDYGAPVDEAGRTTEKYRALRALLAERRPVALPPVPPDPAVIAIPPFALTARQPLLDTLPPRPTRVAPQPLSMEQLDQAYGFVLYRKTFPEGVHGELELHDARDYTITMVNGRTVAKSFAGYGPDSNRVTLDAAGPATLDVLVYNLGRISVIVSERSQDRARKGLIGGATLDGVALTGWEMYSLPFEHGVEVPDRGTSAATAADAPTFFRGTFHVEAPAGTFLDLRAWSMGAAWVNGHALGRFWDRGALRSLFVPAAWLNAGENELVVLELHDAPADPVVRGGTELIAEEPVPFPVRLDRANLAPPAAPR